MVDDEGLVGEIQRQPDDLLGLVRIEHQLEELVMAGEQRNAAAKVFLISDASPWLKKTSRLGPVPAQHLPDAHAPLDRGQAVKCRARIRNREVSKADITSSDAR